MYFYVDVLLYDLVVPSSFVIAFHDLRKVHSTQDYAVCPWLVLNAPAGPSLRVYFLPDGHPQVRILLVGLCIQKLPDSGELPSSSLWAGDPEQVL